MSIEESLQHLGFTKYRARYLANHIQKNPLSDHQTILYWASQYVNSFNNSIIFCLKNSQENGTTAHLTIKTDPRGTDEPVEISVEHVDEYEENNELVNFYNEQSSDKLAETTYWFHGTSKEAAHNIARQGINLRRGKERGDFSDGEGFYLTSNFYFAQNWAQTHNENGAAVVVFKVQNLNFEGGLELSRENIAKWNKIVTYYRNGSTDVNLDYLDDYTYIFGPISKDGGKCDKDPNWKPRIRSDPMGNKLYQVCLKDKALARDFYRKGENIEKVLIYF